MKVPKLAKDKDNAPLCPNCSTELRLCVDITYIEVPFTISEQNEYCYDMDEKIDTGSHIFSIYCQKCPWEFLI